MEPDVISYSAATSACQKCQQWGRALGLLLEMRCSQLQLDVISYSAATGSCEKRHMLEQALSLRQRKRSWQRTRACFVRALISACARIGLVHELVRLFTS